MWALFPRPQTLETGRLNLNTGESVQKFCVAKRTLCETARPRRCCLAARAFRAGSPSAARNGGQPSGCLAGGGRRGLKHALRDSSRASCARAKRAAAGAAAGVLQRVTLAPCWLPGILTRWRRLRPTSPPIFGAGIEQTRPPAPRGGTIPESVHPRAD